MSISTDTWHSLAVKITSNEIILHMALNMKTGNGKVGGIEN